MGIDGIIILDGTGRPIIQTTFRYSPSYALQHVDILNNAYETANTSETSTVDPVLLVETPLGPSACCHVQHNNLRIACPVTSETEPLFVFAFIRTLLDVLQEYLGDVSAGSIRDNFDVVYQLLEEMLDNGYPLTTEPNALRDIVIPPSFFNKILSATGTAGLTKATLTPFSSPIPWRTTGLRYNTNEIFFDFVEEMQAIVSREGTPITVDVWGTLKANTRLTGTPDILLTFPNPQNLVDCSFHPCVRLPKWSRDKALSFVPPDGRFTLMEYRLGSVIGNTISSNSAVPFTLKPKIEILEDSGNIDMVFQPRVPSGSKGLAGVVIELYLGKSTTSANCITIGGSSSCTFDARSHTLQWRIPSAAGISSCQLRGSFTSPTREPRPAPAIQVTFHLNEMNFSALKIQELKVTGESYKPFRGARSSGSGKIEVRW